MRKIITVSLLAGLTVFGAAACNDTKHSTGTATFQPVKTPDTTDSPTAPAPTDAPTDNVPAAAPTDTPTPTEDTSVFGLAPGTALNVESSSDPVGTSTVTVSAPIVIPPGEYDDPAAGQYIGVKVTMHVESGQFDINPFDFTLRSDDGTTVDQAFVTQDRFPELHDGTERAGRSIAGFLIFDLPHGYSGELSYEPGLGDSLGSWTVKVA